MSTETYQTTTQVFLDIYDITNDLLIMKDGTVSVIITVDAMNFGLLAEEEQDAVMYAYAGLLNSLNYPIQIVIRSQTKDVTSYLQKLKEQEDLAPTRENQDRIKRYREFVSNLIRERNVLDKKFYVVIPATPIEVGLMPVSTVVPGSKQFDASSAEKSVLIEKARGILEPKRDHIIGQFGRIGLYSRQLTTQEIIQLFYLSYNPEAAEGQQLTETHNYTTPMVSAQVDTSVRQSAPQRPPQPAPAQQPTQPAVVQQLVEQPLVETATQQTTLPQDVPQPIIEQPPTFSEVQPNTFESINPQALPRIEPVTSVVQTPPMTSEVQTIGSNQVETTQVAAENVPVQVDVSPELPPTKEPEAPLTDYIPPDNPPAVTANDSFNPNTITSPVTEPSTIFSGQTQPVAATQSSEVVTPKITNVLQKIRNTNMASTDQAPGTDTLPKPNNFTVFTQPTPVLTQQPEQPTMVAQPIVEQPLDASPLTSTPQDVSQPIIEQAPPVPAVQPTTIDAPIPQAPAPDTQEMQAAINELADVAVQTPPLDQDTLPPLPEIK